MNWRVMELVGTYNYGLVAISYLVASLASFVALDMAGRITASQGSTSRWWLFAGGSAMGVGIWSMHFIGMLAFKLPIPQGLRPGDHALLAADRRGRFGLRAVAGVAADSCRTGACWAVR